MKDKRSTVKGEKYGVRETSTMDYRQLTKDTFILRHHYSGGEKK